MRSEIPCLHCSKNKIFLWSRLTDWLGIKETANKLQWHKEGLDLDLKEETSSYDPEWLPEKEGSKEAVAIGWPLHTVQSKGSQCQSTFKEKDQAHNGGQCQVTFRTLQKYSNLTVLYSYVMVKMGHSVHKSSYMVSLSISLYGMYESLSFSSLMSLSSRRMIPRVPGTLTVQYRAHWLHLPFTSDHMYVCIWTLIHCIAHCRTSQSRSKKGAS